MRIFPRPDLSKAPNLRDWPLDGEDPRDFLMDGLDPRDWPLEVTL